MQSGHSNETHADAVDYSLIEPSKENIQPLRRGRNPHALLKAIQTPPVKADPLAPPTSALAPGRTDASMKADRKRFEEAIKSYPSDGPTPLAPWLDYIQWTQQSFVHASVKSNLLPLLEKCTRTFLRDARVNQSLRYLHVWFLYMDCVADCLDMFAFLHANGVCTKQAALYDGWSKVLEQRGRWADAADTLQLGLNFGAEPSANLRNSMTRLQARTAKVIAAAVAADPTGATTGAIVGGSSEQRIHAAAQRLADENGTTVRQPLQRIASAGLSTREPAFERPMNGQTVYHNAPGARITHSDTSSNFQVFCDDAPPTTAAAPVPSKSVKQPFASLGLASSSSSSSFAGVAPAWKEYASAKEIGKENSAMPTRWNQPLNPTSETELVAEGAIVTLPIPIAASAFPVFVDSECAAEAAAAAAAAAKDAARLAINPRMKLDGPVLKDANMEKSALASMAKLQANPLRNMKPSASSSAKPAAKQ